VAIALRILAVGEKTLRHDEVQVVFGAGHRHIQRMAFLLDLGGGAEIRYRTSIDRIHEDAETRHADLIKLEQIASGYPSRERLLTELTLDPPDATRRSVLYAAGGLNYQSSENMPRSAAA
jgi:hypothetical protein